MVPTGLLVTMPWAVLAGDRSVTVAPSATAWLAAARTQRCRLGHAARGGPGTARGEAEVRAIAGLRPDARCSPGRPPGATLAALDGAAVAHLAAHGHHEPDNALFSSLDLAGGPLMGYDLQRMSRTPPTVVLSSCDLGLTDVRPGDETVGMAAALLAAGSWTVVASVSRVATDRDDRDDRLPRRGRHRSAAGRRIGGGRPARMLSSFVCFGAG